MAKHNDLGREGERLAKLFLLSKGHVILSENWRCGKLEIDLISDNGHCIVFTEVKTRSTLDYGSPLDAVDQEKELAMINAADIYLRNLHLDVEAQFDLISVVVENETYQIDHIEDALTANYL